MGSRVFFPAATVISFCIGCTHPSPSNRDQMSFLSPVVPLNSSHQTRNPNSLKNHSTSDLHGFDDGHLADLMATNPRGLIYLLSPNMPLSILALDHLKKVARLRNLPLVVLSDREGRDVLPEGVRKNESDRLIQIASEHFPALVVFSGRDRFHVLHGAKSAIAFDQFIFKTLFSGQSVPAEASESRLPTEIVDKSAEPSQWKELKRVPISGVPGYYFKPLSGGKWVAYTKRPFMISTESKNDLFTTPLMRNHLLNLETGESIAIEGQVDPVPTPDEKILSFPYFLGDYANPKFAEHQFFSIPDLIRKSSKELSLILTDRKMPGTYQSFGQFVENGKTIYRIVSETVFERFTLESLTRQDSPRKESFFIQEYELSEFPGEVGTADTVGTLGKYGPVGTVSKPLLRPRFPAAQTLCPGKSFSLPMISKTGQLFAGVDPYTREAKVVSLENHLLCRDVVNLGIPTGKVDFSYDDRMLTFHVSWTRSSEVNETYLNVPKERHNMDVMTFDMVSKELRRATICRRKNANCYYPAFTKNGNIVYLEQNRETMGYAFVVIQKKD